MNDSSTVETTGNGCCAAADTLRQKLISTLEDLASRVNLLPPERYCEIIPALS
jgi:hypothetical protein